MANNPIIGFKVDPADIQYIGNNLQRPECILAEPDGTLWSADARGGVYKLSPDGSQNIITQSFDASFKEASDETSRFTEGTLPNGLAFAENGDILISNFGTDVLEVMTPMSKPPWPWKKPLSKTALPRLTCWPPAAPSPPGLPVSLLAVRI